MTVYAVRASSLPGKYVGTRYNTGSLGEAALTHTDERAIEQVRNWLTDMVIGLQLCPFAAAPLHAGRVRFTTCAETDSLSIYRVFLSELDEFLQTSPEEVETGLFIVTRGLSGFDDYLDMLATLEDALHEAGLEGVVQIASFHPDYRFEGCDPDDPANFTNRSPFPIFHLIREAGLEAALARFPDPESIPERNVARMRELGLETLQARLAALRGCEDQGGPKS